MPHLKISLWFAYFSNRVLDCLTIEDGTDRLSRNVGNLTNNLHCVRYHKSEYLEKGLIVVIGETESIER